MRSSKTARSSIVVLIALGILLLSQSAAKSETLAYSLVAGSGRVGVADGPAQSAEFVMPTEIIRAPGGRLIVADTGGQRIRVIDKAGNVSTLAGGGPINDSGLWVDGSFRDGPAALARFNRPDGLALGKDGSLFVSDRDNKCIRRILNGQVSTFSGTSRKEGAIDGSADVATFYSPRALTIDDAGVLWLADWGNGVRRIRPDGSVTTISPKGATIEHPTGISFAADATRRRLIVADQFGLVTIDLTTMNASRMPAYPTGHEGDGQPINANAQLGLPHAVSLMNPDEVVYTDLRDSSVKYFKPISYLRNLGEVPREDSMLTGGGLSPDGEVPRFDAPMGVLAERSGDVFVADSGNRKVVHIAPFERRAFIMQGDIAALARTGQEYRVAIVGSSYTWYFTTRADAISGFLAEKLKDVPELRGREPAMEYFLLAHSVPGELDLIRNVLSLGSTDLVILMLAPVDLQALGVGPHYEDWAAVIKPKLASVVATMKSANVPFLLVLNPASQVFSPLESAALWEGWNGEPFAEGYERAHADELRLLSAMDAPVLDLYPAFREEMISPNHRPLFYTNDAHYSEYGRRLIASEIFRKLQEIKPWSAR